MPIPVFYHRSNGEVLLNADTLEHIQALIAEHGADVWWEKDEADLLPPAYADQADQWRKGTDTMDVVRLRLKLGCRRQPAGQPELSRRPLPGRVRPAPRLVPEFTAHLCCREWPRSLQTGAHPWLRLG